MKTKILCNKKNMNTKLALVHEIVSVEVENPFSNQIYRVFVL